MKKKKIVSLALSAVLLVSLLSGCGKSNANSDNAANSNANSDNTANDTSTDSAQTQY